MLQRALVRGQWTGAVFEPLQFLSSPLTTYVSGSKAIKVMKATYLMYDVLSLPVFHIN